MIVRIVYYVLVCICDCTFFTQTEHLNHRFTYLPPPSIQFGLRVYKDKLASSWKCWGLVWWKGRIYVYLPFWVSCRYSYYKVNESINRPHTRLLFDFSLNLDFLIFPLNWLQRLLIFHAYFFRTKKVKLDKVEIKLDYWWSTRPFCFACEMENQITRCTRSCKKHGGRFTFSDSKTCVCFRVNKHTWLSESKSGSWMWR